MSFSRFISRHAMLVCETTIYLAYKIDAAYNCGITRCHAVLHNAMCSVSRSHCNRFKVMSPVVLTYALLTPTRCMKDGVKVC